MFLTFHTANLRGKAHIVLLALALSLLAFSASAQAPADSTVELRASQGASPFGLLAKAVQSLRDALLGKSPVHPCQTNAAAQNPHCPPAVTRVGPLIDPYSIP